VVNAKRFQGSFIAVISTAADRCKHSRRSIREGRVRPVVVVIFEPNRQLAASTCEAERHLYIQAFVAQSSVDAFDVQAARPNEVQMYSVRVCPKAIALLANSRSVVNVIGFGCSAQRNKLYQARLLLSLSVVSAWRPRTLAGVLAWPKAMRCRCALCLRVGCVRSSLLPYRAGKYAWRSIPLASASASICGIRIELCGKFPQPQA
jgi:hypothetical protein